MGQHLQSSSSGWLRTVFVEDCNERAAALLVLPALAHPLSHPPTQVTIIHTPVPPTSHPPAPDVDRLKLGLAKAEGDVDVLLTCEWPAGLCDGLPDAAKPPGLSLDGKQGREGARQASGRAGRDGVFCGTVSEHGEHGAECTCLKQPQGALPAGAAPRDAAPALRRPLGPMGPCVQARRCVQRWLWRAGRGTTLLQVRGHRACRLKGPAFDERMLGSALCWCCSQARGPSACHKEQPPAAPVRRPSPAAQASAPFTRGRHTLTKIWGRAAT